MVSNSSSATSRPLTARPSGPLGGACQVPGDKSISHRALMFGAIAEGESEISGLLEGEDVLRTAEAMRALGATVERETGPDGPIWRVRGRGLDGLVEPAGVLDLGNSGTAARLLTGLLAGRPMTCFMTGDASLTARPMNRVTVPLSAMGARFETRAGGRLPMAIVGADAPSPITYRLPVASAQVKSAVLLAGLSAEGRTIVEEPVGTRDHTERMLTHFGASVRVEPPDGKRPRRIAVTGPARLKGASVAVPGDISSAAFPIVAALITGAEELRIANVGLNPLRTGILDSLIEMGARIELADTREQGGEPVADLIVRKSTLIGIDVPADRAPRMIDEYPILSVAAAFAEGTTRMNGLGELRVKETDRLAAMHTGLSSCGVTAEAGEDWLAVTGTGGRPAGGVTVASELDHRIAMSFLVLGLAAENPVSVDDGSPIETSFPDFAGLIETLAGAPVIQPALRATG